MLVSRLKVSGIKYTTSQKEFVKMNIGYKANVDLAIVNNKKENLPNSGLCHIPADHRVKPKESEKRDKHVHLARELKKTMEHESDGDANSNCCTRYSH